MPVELHLTGDREQTMQAACVLLQYPDIFYEVFDKYKLTNSDFNSSVTSFVAGGGTFRVLPLCSTQPRYLCQEWPLCHESY